ncbi:MAG: hypothetical protein ALECFALPRED_002039 [Alectoria fallacina]|uniref:Gag1-like clamp domain-containing protein n=1 Tax=Alectoria fallacina TaxID=1903189 RepID=A0A8H3FHR2_9LECA|nr:MAG: hypothetical protein ALECFALPRED_002039 [Alectoria fallacina]
MLNSSADNLPSLSSTCPATDTTENTSSGGHETPSLSNHGSDLQPKITKRPVTSKVNDEAVRAAKQQIRSKLREDWTWPPTSSPPDTLDSLDAISEWCERDSDSSIAHTPPGLNPDPYKYDSPDSLHQPVLSRKRKRQRRLKEEMEWNEGLRTYVERRDAWAGARTRPWTPPPTSRSPFESPYSQAQPPTNGSTSPPPSPRTLVPVAPPILPPDHPIRATVQPATYPQIYSKIIVQGLAPTVPINLKDVVNSLVSGWKKDGEWPPKNEADKAGQVYAAAGEGMGMGMGAHPRKAVKRSVGKVKKVLGFGHGEDDGEVEEEGKPF